MNEFLITTFRYFINREAEEGITVSSTPAGYVYIPARRAAANIPVAYIHTSEDNLTYLGAGPG